MIAIFKIVQGIVQTMMETAGLGNAVSASLPQELITTIESCGFFESIPLWAVTLIGGIVVTILAYVMIAGLLFSNWCMQCINIKTTIAIILSYTV